MIPILFEFRLFGWDLSLPTYGVLLATAFLVALGVALRQARRAGIEPNIISDLWIISLLSGVVGAKLLLYLLDLPYYLEHPRAILGTLRSAGVWYGGLILAIAACLIAVRRRGLDVWLIGDILAPAIAVGQAIGRLGCFAAGCCYGKPANVPWAVLFTDERAHSITGVPLNVALHPTQIYHAIANLVLFVILIVAASRKRFAGQVLLLYLILYAAMRGTLEIFRGDERGSLMGLSTSQILSIVVGIIALALYIRRSRRGGPEEPDRSGRERRPAAPAG